MHYLQTGQILSLDALNASLCKDGKPVRPQESAQRAKKRHGALTSSSRNRFLVRQLVAASPEDYVLGVADLTGELMRYAINAIGQGNHAAAFDILATLRSLSAGACRSLRGRARLRREADRGTAAAGRWRASASVQQPEPVPGVRPPRQGDGARRELGEG